MNVCQSQTSCREAVSSPITFNSPMSTSEIPPFNSPTLTRIEQKTSSEGENKLLEEQLKLISDDVFQVNLEHASLKCLFCHDDSKQGFDVTDVEYESLATRSQKFRNLTKALKKHIKLDSHKKNVNDDLVIVKKVDVRNREMGRCIGTFSYFIYYNNISFKLFTSFMLWFTLCNIDMGEVNHSTHFVENFVTSVYQVLLKLFQSFIEKPYLAPESPLHSPYLETKEP